MKNNRNSPPFGKLAKPAQRALANAGITAIDQLKDWTEADLMKLHGFGKNGLEKLKTEMATANVNFK
jgi:DNA-directed RNA polymerase alpha subunit